MENKRILKVYYENKPCYNIIVRFNFTYLVENLIKITNDKPCKIAIITDSNVAPLYLEEVRSIIASKYNDIITYVLPAGEKNKTLDNVKLLYEVLIKSKFYRTDLLVALGGGVIGDMVGYAAATFLRGIDFVQIPTTLLSQVDSSIGGKTGVDFDSYKNMVGAFHMPKLVYMNVSVLNSLPKEQFSSGMAEVIKHGIIMDRGYFDWLYDNKQKILEHNPDILAQMIYKSCIIKRDIVQTDPTEKGIRAYLNFGHTIGHAIEKLSDFTLSHGACVALGSIAASRISSWQNYINNVELKEIEDLFLFFGLGDLVNCDPKKVLLASKSDKKMSATGIKFILIKSIGEAFIFEGLEDEIILKAIRGISRG